MPQERNMQNGGRKTTVFSSKVNQQMGRQAVQTQVVLGSKLLHSGPVALGPHWAATTHLPQSTKWVVERFTHMLASQQTNREEGSVEDSRCFCMSNNCLDLYIYVCPSPSHIELKFYFAKKLNVNWDSRHKQSCNTMNNMSLLQFSCLHF